MELRKIKEGTQKGFKKFWFLLWKDNSLKGWLFSLVFLFVFIKFVFFPLLNLATGTSLSLAIVESCSMHHKGNVFSDFDNWFDRHEEKYLELNVTKNEFEKFILRRGFSKGDILFLVRAKPDKLEVGDVIAFKSGIRKSPVIHRIIKIEKKVDAQGVSFLTFTTIGDNNAGFLIPSNNIGQVDETEIREEQIVGKAVFRVVPFLGWVKLIFFEYTKPVSERGICKEN
jgi:signal peptidase I